MAALTATDWTVAVVDRRQANGERVHRCSMTLATVGTYPTGGVPIPTSASSYGMVQAFRYLSIYDSGQGSGLVPKYSATGNVIRFYEEVATTSDAGTAQGALVEMATTATAGTGGAVVLYVQAYGY